MPASESSAEGQSVSSSEFKEFNGEFKAPFGDLPRTSASVGGRSEVIDGPSSAFVGGDVSVFPS